MKKTLKFFAFAIVLCLAASCAKDKIISIEDLQEKTFSATIENPNDNKAVIEDDGIFKFSAGDYILVFNNNPTGSRLITKTQYAEVSGKIVATDNVVTTRIIAEKITITDAMLSNGGRTLNFSTVVSEPATPASRADCYHFVYLSADAYSDYFATSTRNDDNSNYGAATTVYRRTSNYTESTRKVMCYARSNDKAGNLKFYHFDSQFKFKVSDTESYDKVTFEVNGTVGAKNCINPDICFYPGRVIDYTKEYSGSNLSYNPNSVNEGKNPSWDKGAYQYVRNSNGSSDIINVTLSGNAASTYYVAVPALYPYENGVTITLWKNDNKVKTLEAKQPITTATAGILNFGDIAALKKYTSYYEMWKDGKSFKIGETVVDPTQEPYKSMTPIYVESDCNISSITGWANAHNVYFIKKGVTLTIDSAKYWNDDIATLYIIGEEVGTKSNVVWQKTLAPRGGAVALKNINITSSVDNSLDTEGKLSSYMIVDGCRIVLPAGDFARAVSGASSGWDKIELVNNDFIYTGGSNGHFARVLPTAAYTFTSLVVKNNQSYTSDGTLAGYQSNLVWDYWQGRTSFQSIDVENNTFVNCAYDYNVIYGAAQGVAVGGTLTIKNNLNYVDGAATGYAKLVLLADGNKTGVTISTTNNFAWATSNVSKLQVWGNVSCTAFSADPFESKDFTNGKFVLTSTAAAAAPGCGAKR